MQEKQEKKHGDHEAATWCLSLVVGNVGGGWMAMTNDD